MIVIYAFKKFILNKNKKELSFLLIYKRKFLYRNNICVFTNF